MRQNTPLKQNKTPGCCNMSKTLELVRKSAIVSCTICIEMHCITASAIHPIMIMKYSITIFVTFFFGWGTEWPSIPSLTIMFSFVLTIALAATSCLLAQSERKLSFFYHRFELIHAAFLCISNRLIRFKVSQLGAFCHCSYCFVILNSNLAIKQQQQQQQQRKTEIGFN